MKNCNDYLRAELAQSPEVRVILALGAVAHAALLRACGLKTAQCRFAHAAEHALGGGRVLRRLLSLQPLQHADPQADVTAMFEAVVGRAVELAA